jgi:hypothetical protein
MKQGRIAAESAPDPQAIEAQASAVFDIAIRVEPGEGGRPNGLFVQR